jgi:hypothetical protein
MMSLRSTRVTNSVPFIVARASLSACLHHLYELYEKFKSEFDNVHYNHLIGTRNSYIPFLWVCACNICRNCTESLTQILVLCIKIN